MVKNAFKSKRWRRSSFKAYFHTIQKIISTILSIVYTTVRC